MNPYEEPTPNTPEYRTWYLLPMPEDPIEAIRWRFGRSYEQPEDAVEVLLAEIARLQTIAAAARALGVVHDALHRRGDPDWEGWECDEQNALRAALAGGSE